MQKIVAIGLRVSAPQIRDFDALQGWLVFNAFWGFLQLATAYTRKRIFTKNIQKTSFQPRMCLYGVSMTTINI